MSDQTFSQPQRTGLRPMTADDVDAVVAVQREAAISALGHIFPQHEHPFPVDEIREQWVGEIADPQTDCFVITDENGEVAGFVATRGDQFLHFGTATGAWGTGLASEAHREALDHLRGQGHEQTWLWVLEDNQRAIRFYTRRGWLDEGTRQESTFAPRPMLQKMTLAL